MRVRLWPPLSVQYVPPPPQSATSVLLGGGRQPRLEHVVGLCFMLMWLMHRSLLPHPLINEGSLQEQARSYAIPPPVFISEAGGRHSMDNSSEHILAYCTALEQCDAWLTTEIPLLCELHFHLVSLITDASSNTFANAQYCQNRTTNPQSTSLISVCLPISQ